MVLLVSALVERTEKYTESPLRRTRYLKRAGIGGIERRTGAAARLSTVNAVVNNTLVEGSLLVERTGKYTDSLLMRREKFGGGLN